MARNRFLSDGEITEMLQEDNSEASDNEIDFDDSVQDPSYSPNEDSDDDDEFDVRSNLERMHLEEEEENSAASDAEENDEPSQVQWSDYNNRTQSFPYIGQGGLNVTLPNDINPQQIYERLVDQDVISLIVRETNLYAQQCTSSRTTRSSSPAVWKPTNDEEIKKFLGLIIWMGLVKKGKIANYWSTNPLYKNEVAPSIMSRNRFQELLRYIHFADNVTIDPTDRRAKILALVDLLQSKFQKLYTPEESIVIDESLVPWRGRLIFRQYIPSKAHKYGIKLFKLCAGQGYCWSLQMYVGKNGTGGREVGLTQRICEELTRGLRSEGRTLYIDNFYTSYPLARFMLAEKTHVVGTVRPSRAKLPKEVLKKKLQRGEMVAQEESHGILVLKWRDTRDVHVLSTKHGPDMEEAYTSRRRPLLAANAPSTSNTTSSARSKLKPKAVIEYNKGKAGIDLSDQIGAYASVLRKGIKWYRKLAFELLLGVAVVNAYFIFKKHTATQIGIREFREKLAFTLLELKRAERLPLQPVRGQHYMAEPENKSSKTRRRCKLCYKRLAETHGREIASKKAKLVNTFCQTCPKKPFFCLPCFQDFHTG